MDSVDHVLRPLPPWHAHSLTECGLTVEATRPVLTREEFIARLKDQGLRRASLSTCMTCLETARRYTDWAHNPTQVMLRHVTGLAWKKDREAVVNAELRALAALVAEHPEEFYSYLKDLDETSSLAAARAAKRKRERRTTGQRSL